MTPPDPRPLVPPAPDRSAVGLAFDARSDLVFAAGGVFGTAYVYDAGSGRLAAAYQLNTSGTPGLVNDVVVTRQAAYFTDSFRDVLYRVPLDAAGAPPTAAAITEIPLIGDFLPGPGAPLGVHANGIAATSDGKHLILVHTDMGTLYRVDPATGAATLIDLGGAALVFGDGILLDGLDLYVVQNFLNQIVVVRLASDLASGSVTGVITDARLRIPSTIARFGAALYAVNARFDVAPPTGPADPSLAFDVVRVAR